MRILHTADWHLGDRLHNIRREEDLHARVREIMALCETHAVDTLVIAGDIFSDVLSAAQIREELTFLIEQFRPFFARGGTVVAITGNHDKDPCAEIIRQAMSLGDPLTVGGLLRPGRLIFSTRASFFRLPRPDGSEVQFVLMPYPIPERYLDMADAPQDFAERNRALRLAYTLRLTELAQHARFRNDLPTVLVAHLAVQGVDVSRLYKLTEADDILLPAGDVPGAWAYTALGHIHQPQAVPGMVNARYSGSIDRLDFGEEADDKSVILLDIGPIGLLAEPRLIPLAATRLQTLCISDADSTIESLRTSVPDWETAIIRVQMTGDPAHDATLSRLARNAFPRMFVNARPPAPRIIATKAEIEVEAALPRSHTTTATARSGIVAYLESQIPDLAEREAIITHLNELLAEETLR